jgi:hypothetical protein
MTFFSGKNASKNGGGIQPKAEAISRKDVLTPFEEFERCNEITEVREDIPYEYLGISPSKYYRIIDMDIEKAREKTSRLLKRAYF